MPWAIGQSLQAAFGAFKAPAQKSLSHDLASFGADVATFGPLAQLAPTVADRIDRVSQRLLAPDFPKELPSAPAGFTSLVPGQPSELLPSAGLHLTHSQTAASFGIHMNTAGDARLDMNAAGPGTNWGQRGAESSVLSLYLNGRYHQDVVLAMGDRQAPYALSLGKLPAGDHTLTLRYAEEKSAPGAQGVSLASMRAEAVTYPSQEARWAAENSPVLLGRNGLANNANDTPLAMYHRITRNADGTVKISYHFAFSNEDGGTGSNPALEQALYGRNLDLQHVYDVTLDPQGQVLNRAFEAPFHKMSDFKGGLTLRADGGAGGRELTSFNGELDGTHAIVRTAATNNDVSDLANAAGSPLRFRFPADYPLDNLPDEAILLKRPEFYRVNAEEIQREGKIDSKGIGSRPDPSPLGFVKSQLMDLIPGHQRTMADPRNYLYTQFKAQGAEASPIGARIQLKNGQCFDSDLGNPKARIGSSGWSQAAVRLPPGTRPEDVQAIAYATEGQGHIVSQGPTYMLDADFKLQPLDLKSK